MPSDLPGRIGQQVPVQQKTIVLNDDDDFLFDKAIVNHINFARVFIPDRDGVMSIVEGGGDTVLVPCVKGIPVVGIVKRFRLTGTTASMTGVAGT